MGAEQADQLEAAMKPTISHDFEAETPDAKARWFQSLSLAQRMELLCSLTDLILAANPGIAEQSHAQPASGRVRVVRNP